MLYFVQDVRVILITAGKDADKLVRRDLMYPNKRVYLGHICTRISDSVYKIDNPYITDAEKVLTNYMDDKVHAYIEKLDVAHEVRVLAVAFDEISVYQIDGMPDGERFCWIGGGRRLSFNDEEPSGHLWDGDETEVTIGNETIEGVIDYPTVCKFRGSLCRHVKNGVYKFDKPLLATESGLTNPSHEERVAFGIECISKKHFFIHYVIYSGTDYHNLENFLAEEFGKFGKVYFYQPKRGECFSFGFENYYAVIPMKVPEDAPEPYPDTWEWNGIPMKLVRGDVYKAVKSKNVELSELVHSENPYLGFICRDCMNGRVEVLYVSKWCENVEWLMRIAYRDVGDKGVLFVQTLSFYDVHRYRGYIENNNAFGKSYTKDVEIIEE